MPATESHALTVAPPKVTRGSGLLESWLAKQRTSRANLLIPDHLRSGRVLDIGCGTHPNFLANTRFREKYSLDQIPMAPETEERHQIRHCTHDLDVDPRMPFEDGTFSAVVLLAFIEHVQPEIAVNILQEGYRVLATGGVMVVTTPAAWSDGLLRAMAKMGLVSAEEIHEHAFAYTLSTLGVAMGRAGFSVRRFKTGYFELGMNLWAVGQK